MILMSQATKSSSWEVHGRRVGQENARSSNRKVHYYPDLNHMDTVHTLPLRLIRIHLNIIKSYV
jgi:hypothetical protein